MPTWPCVLCPRAQAYALPYRTRYRNCNVSPSFRVWRATYLWARLRARLRARLQVPLFGPRMHYLNAVSCGSYLLSQSVWDPLDAVHSDFGNSLHPSHTQTGITRSLFEGRSALEIRCRHLYLSYHKVNEGSGGFTGHLFPSFVCTHSHKYIGYRSNCCHHLCTTRNTPQMAHIPHSSPAHLWWRPFQKIGTK